MGGTRKMSENIESGYKVCKVVDDKFFSVCIPVDITWWPNERHPPEVKGVEYFNGKWTNAPHTDYPLTCFKELKDAQDFAWGHTLPVIIPCDYVLHPVWGYVATLEDWVYNMLGLWTIFPDGTVLATKVKLTSSEPVGNGRY